MEPITAFILFPLIGAAIGAVTNEIAIRMLFRPYKAWYIGKAKVPFTPGVIPSQRHIIAGNIAETFEKHLLSGEEIHNIIISGKTKAIIEAKVDEILASLGPLAAVAGAFKGMIVAKILESIDEFARKAVSDGELDIRQKIEDKINAMEIATLEELILGFSRKQFRHITLFGAILGGLIGFIQAALSMVLFT